MNGILIVDFLRMLALAAAQRRDAVGSFGAAGAHSDYRCRNSNRVAPSNVNCT